MTGRTCCARPRAKLEEGQQPAPQSTLLRTRRFIPGAAVHPMGTGGRRGCARANPHVCSSWRDLTLPHLDAQWGGLRAAQACGVRLLLPPAQGAVQRALPALPARVRLGPARRRARLLPSRRQGGRRAAPAHARAARRGPRRRLGHRQRRRGGGGGGGRRRGPGASAAWAAAPCRRGGGRGAARRGGARPARPRRTAPWRRALPGTLL